MITKQDPSKFQFEILKFDDVSGKTTVERCCTPEEFIEALTLYLKREHTWHNGSITDFAYDLLDYISISHISTHNVPIEPFQDITCEVVRGSNEGYYFHIDYTYVDRDSKLQRCRIATAKTLCGVKEALILNHFINRFILEKS